MFKAVITTVVMALSEKQKTAFQIRLRQCAVTPLRVCSCRPNRTVGDAKAPTLKCCSRLPQCAVGHYISLYISQVIFRVIFHFILTLTYKYKLHITTVYFNNTL